MFTLQDIFAQLNLPYVHFAVHFRSHLGVSLRSINLKNNPRHNIEFKSGVKIFPLIGIINHFTTKVSLSKPQIISPNTNLEMYSILMISQFLGTICASLWMICHFVTICPFSTWLVFKLPDLNPIVPYPNQFDSIVHHRPESNPKWYFFRPRVWGQIDVRCVKMGQFGPSLNTFLSPCTFPLPY